MASSQFQDPSLERTFRGHKDTVTSVSFAPGGPMKQLVSSAVDGSLMLWNFKPQLRAFRFLGHRGPVYHAEFAPSGQLIASGAWGHQVGERVPGPLRAVGSASPPALSHTLPPPSPFLIMKKQGGAGGAGV